ncbi:hypothetical protein [Amycolatopsis sp. NPDC049868]|uniref:hypothetical protein n=1 Tax=Amycolatopsis sp. NPDC049868 TaxID=3363934 RepID=UPI0037A30855
MPDTPAHQLLRDIREQAELTKKDFSLSLTYSTAHVGKVLAGEMSISPELAYHVQEEYGVPAMKLLMLQARAQLEHIASDKPKDRSNPNTANRVNLDEDAVEKASRDGISIATIAAALSVSHGTIWRILHRRQVPMRAHSRKHAPNP